MALDVASLVYCYSKIFRRAPFDFLVGELSDLYERLFILGERPQ